MVVCRQKADGCNYFCEGLGALAQGGRMLVVR
jgi:hypothetical protein